MKAQSATKGRCWKGCKPVPGKKPYSKGSCSCGMSALTPGMIEFADGLPYPKTDQKTFDLIKQYRKDGVAGPLFAYADELRSQRLRAEAQGKKYAKVLRRIGKLSALTPGMIEFARGDRAIPALKKALAKGIGNAGEPVSIHEIGVSGTMVPSLRGNAKNVQRATKKFWGEDEGLGQATGAMRYNRDWAAKTIKEDRRSSRKSDPTRYKWQGFPRRLVGEENLPEPLRSERMRSRMGLSALTPGMVAFALGEDNRPRNGNGQFLANETGGADPNSMAAAYGNVEAEKMARRQNLMGRLKAMMGR